jgi:hypothetical protein
MEIVGERKSGQDVKLTGAKTYNTWSYSSLTIKCSEMVLVEAMEELTFINPLYSTLLKQHSVYTTGLKIRGSNPGREKKIFLCSKSSRLPLG